MTNTMETEKEQKAPAAKGLAVGVKVALVAGAVLVAAAAAWFYTGSKAHESTDNAFLEGNIVQVSPRVGGQVLRVYVQDNQHVNRGDLLAEIDPKDYQTHLAEVRARQKESGARESGARSGLALTSEVSGAVLDQARAGLAAARDQVSVLRARLAQDEAAVHAAEAGLEQAAARQGAAQAEAQRASVDAARYRALYQKDEVSRQQLDRAETEAKTLAANLAAVQKMVAVSRAQLTQAQAGESASAASLRLSEKQVLQAEGRLKEAQSAPQQVRIRQSDVASAQAQQEQVDATAEQAQLSLSYTKIYAADSGFITKKSVEPGNFVQPGQALMALVSDRLWVVANFKETQLERMRPGQNVSIRVDAYPQMRLRGRVDSIQSGTGSRFSLMPPENATGNYVKVVQRIPVKIVLVEQPPAGYRLGPGMSVEPEVHVQ